MASIKIPTPLRAYTGGNAEIQVSGQTVQEALNNLTAQYPDLRKHLFNEDKLRDFVNVFIGEDNITDRDGIETPIDAGDRLRIIPSIAGG
jgi:sulfur-carrier protein